MRPASVPHCGVVPASPVSEKRGGFQMQAVARAQGESGIQDAPRDILPQRGEGSRMTGHVLIVDDDQSMAETLTKAMTRRGFVVTWKTSAADALTLLDEQDFDVVVTDLH